MAASERSQQSLCRLAELEVVIIVSSHYGDHQYRGQNWLPWESRQSRAQASA
jgi:hypothetical protein